MKNGLFVAIGLSSILTCAAVEPGESVVVVYNTRVPESKGVAEHYANIRHVPSNQVFGLDLPITEAISRAEYRSQLEQPLLAKLIDGKLLELTSKPRPKVLPPEYSPVTRASIRYIVLCYGVPLKITADASLKEPGVEKRQPELQRNEAAVDTELALLSLSRDTYQISGPTPNPFYSTTNRATFHPTNNVLMVTRLDGPTPEIARGLVDKAVQAETNGFWGRAYFDTRGLTNGEHKAGDDWIRSASTVARRLGFETTVDTNAATWPASFPMSQIALYVGWYDGGVSGPFTRAKVEFMPGAFAYHLHSFNAQTIRSATANWTGPLLAKGATITFGSVEEPYLAGTPNPAVFLERLIWNKFTFGEAAYAAQPVLSWQTTIIGDPLYRPFAEPPDQLHFRLEAAKSPLIAWSHLRVINLNQASGASSLDELLKYLDEIPMTKESAVLQEKLGDLLRDKKQLSAATEAYTKAAKLNPSPLQKVRLLLIVGELQKMLAREQEALDAYTQLIAAAPDYPELPQIYARAISLARTLGKTNEVEKLESELKQRR
ncbi:MAG TPA: TIGR03790 family protein [Candidatus Acidoferrum sp.]|nr:TIGR03790 family protein [Candidatus Acidoferrum sp.]